jgi:hypothetical protein
MDFTDFLNHNIFTVTQLSPDVQSLFQQSFRFVLHYVDQLAPGTSLYHRFFQLLEYLPMLLLSAPPNLNHLVATDIVKKKCRKFLDGQLQKLFSDTRKFARKILPVRDHDPLSAQLSAIKRAEQCALAGNLSKALQVLLDTDQRVINDPYDRLLELHPQRSRHTSESLYLHPEITKNIVLELDEKAEETFDYDLLLKTLRRSRALKAPDRFGTRVREHMLDLLSDRSVAEQYLRSVIIPILKGKFYRDDQSTGLGAQVIPIPKPIDDVRPIQIVDFPRWLAGAMLFTKVVFNSLDSIEYFANEKGNSPIDSHVVQNAFSRDGITLAIKTVQAFLERSEVFHSNPAFTSELSVLMKIDIKNFFPSVDRQLIFDVLAGSASRDYPKLGIKDGEDIPSKPQFQYLLPFMAATYGQPIKMTLYSRGHEGRTIPFDDGVGQGDPPGSFGACLGLHPCLHAVSARASEKYRDADFIIQAATDDILIGARAPIACDIATDLISTLEATLNVTVNIQKSAICPFQLHDQHDHGMLDPLLDKYPTLKPVPICTEGLIYLGAPIGYPNFISKFLDDKIGLLRAQASKVLQLRNAYATMRIIKFSLNQRIMYLLRTVQQEFTRPFAHQFDCSMLHLMGQFLDYHAVLDKTISGLVPSASQAPSPMPTELRILLAQHQLRQPPPRGGIGLQSMAEAAGPAFYAATMDFILRAKAAAELQIRPFPLPSVLHDHVLHLSTSMKVASSALESRGAVVVTEPPPEKDQFCIPSLHTVFSKEISDTLHPVCLKLTIQHRLIQAFSDRSPDVTLVEAVLKANPNDLARVSHLQQVLIQGSDPRLAVEPSKPIKYIPMAFLTSQHSSMISKFQLGLYAKMCLGIDVKPPNYDNCPCGAQFGTNLGHPLGCNKWAGKSWHAAHNGVVTAVKEIAVRAGLRATDNNSTLRSTYRHLTSGKVADAFIDGGGHLSVTDALPTSGLQHPKFMVDVTVYSPIATNGTWDGHSNAEGTWTSTALLAREAHKFGKHEGNYAALDLGFLALAVSTFGLLGPTFIRFLSLLAAAKVTSFVEYRSHQHLRQLSEDELPRLKAQYLSAMFAHVGDATAKGTIMRFLGTPQPPLVPPFRGPCTRTIFFPSLMLVLSPGIHFGHAGAARLELLRRQLSSVFAIECPTLSFCLFPLVPVSGVLLVCRVCRVGLVCSS